MTSVSDEAEAALDKMSVQNWKGVHLFKKHWSSLTLEELRHIGVRPSLEDMSSAVLEGNARWNLSEAFVYLTGDAPETLSTFSPDTVYIIGGIVDKNRHKSLTLTEAQKHGVPARRLPIRENIELTSSAILTCNQVFQIVSAYLHHATWKDALRECIPQRKRHE
jgi:hypothetical protein